MPARRQKVPTCAAYPPAARSTMFNPPWGQLPEKIWALIIAQLDFNDQLSMQATCRRFMQLLASTPGIWGRVEMTARETNSSSSVWQICNWVQQRAKGITALGYIFSSGDSQQRQHMTRAWHALVASTAGTGIRLRLSGLSSPPFNALSPPSRAQLVQRLTCLKIGVTSAADIAVIYSLAALRHLKMASWRDVDAQQLTDPAGVAPADCRMTSLRTLQLVRMPPAAFFTPGTAACLQQLHSLTLEGCPLPDGVLPSEMLRLQSLSRLELLQPPLRMMPDLRQLPALRVLIMSRKGDGLDLDASQAECSAELRAALAANPLGGAAGLTEAVLHNMPVATQECAEAIGRLPHLKLLALDFLASDDAAYWAATLQQQMRGRCDVRPASDYVVTYESTVLPVSPWPDTDW